jgi:glycosyltransferase involved in cell wall biosynthesis
VYEAGAREGVEFRGWTDDPAKALRELDVLAVPSAACEASPRVIMEALSAGTVVVAYPSGGIPELIRNGHDGLLTDDCSSEALAKSIKILAGNPWLRNRLAENGRNTFQLRFTVERFRREVCDEMQVAAASAGHSG